MRLAERRAPARGDRDVFLGPPTADRLGLAVGGSHQALLLEAPQGAVDGAERDLPARTVEERLPNRDAVGLVAEPGQREEHELLEFAEVVGHGLYIVHIEH